MSEQNENNVRGEEAELSDEAMEQVAGGCQQGESGGTVTFPWEPIVGPMTYPTSPTIDIGTIAL